MAAAVAEAGLPEELAEMVLVEMQEYLMVQDPHQERLMLVVVVVVGGLPLNSKQGAVVMAAQALLSSNTQEYSVAQEELLQPCRGILSIALQAAGAS
jgi:hypothetical protein